MISSSMAGSATRSAHLISGLVRNASFPARKLFSRPNLDAEHRADKHERTSLGAEASELGWREREVRPFGSGPMVGDGGRIETAAKGHGAECFDGGGERSRSVGRDFERVADGACKPGIGGVEA